jgi:hypothetical protein
VKRRAAWGVRAMDSNSRIPRDVRDLTGGPGDPHYGRSLWIRAASPGLESHPSRRTNEIESYSHIWELGYEDTATAAVFLFLNGINRL